jgi:BMFP domain-containing protein YqiC
LKDIKTLKGMLEMQSNNRIFGDLARVASGAMSAAAGARDELEQLLQHRFERFLNDRGWISREEFDATHAMAQKAREEQELINDKLNKIEAKLSDLNPAKARKRQVSKRP